MTLAEAWLSWHVIPRLCKTAIVGALACSIGLHWAFFQSLAWVGMVISYSQTATFSEALVKTFDGQHPCLLCQEIAKGKRSEKKSDTRRELTKFEFSHVRTAFVFTRPTAFWKTSNPRPAGRNRKDQPPAPPPKSLA